MFEINYTNHEKMFSETVRCVKAIEGIQEFVKFQNQLYDMSEDWVCFGDDQIDSLAYYPEKKRTICQNHRQHR